MNLMKNKSKFMVVVLFSLLTVVLIPQVLARPSNSDQIQIDSNVNLSQVELVQPNLFIQSIEINDGKLAEDGTLVKVDITIINEDNVTYIGLDLVIKIEENKLVQHGPKPLPEISNKSLAIIPANTNLNQQLSFPGKYGQYTLTASLVTNGTILPNSIYSMTFQVINKPMGSILSLSIAIISVISISLLLVAVPHLIEKLKNRIYAT